MPRQKKYHRYPEEYNELIRKAQHNEITLKCDSHKSARTARIDLYNFRLALREEAEKDPNLSALSRLADKLTFSLRGDTITIKVPSGYAPLINSALMEEDNGE